MTAARSKATLRRGEAATWGERPALALPRIRKWTPYRNPAGTMDGYLDIELPSGMRLFGCKLMVGPKGARWIGAGGVFRTL
jgi:hypothetical protein